MGLTAAAIPAIMTGLGAAGTLAGAGMSMKAAQNSRKAMNNEVMNNLAQQELYKGQAQPVFNQQLNEASVGRQQQREATGQEAAMQRYQQANAAYAQPGSLPIDRSRAQYEIAHAQQAGAGAQGYQSAAMDNWIRNQIAQQQLGVIGNLASSTAGTAPILTQLAGQQSAALGAAGSLLSTAGGLAGIYGGLARANSPTPAPKTPTAK